MKLNSLNYNNTLSEKLQDIKNGKEQPWKKKKLDTIEVSYYYQLMAEHLKREAAFAHPAHKPAFISEALYFERKLHSFENCANFLEFKKFLSDGALPMKLNQAYFCKNRLCPCCTWRRSLKIFGQVSKVMDKATADNDWAYIFLTLTVQNVSGDKLPETLDKLFHSWQKFVQRKPFRKISKGWFRALEITHNWLEDDYHPHFHVIVAVNKSYFDTSLNYLSFEKWLKLWQSCLGNEKVISRGGVEVTNGGVYVKKVRPNSVAENALYSSPSDLVSYGKAVAELSKYATEKSSYILKRPTAEQIRLYEDLQNSDSWKFDNRGNLKLTKEQDEALKHVQLCKQLEEGKPQEEIETLYESLTMEAIRVMDTSLKGRRLISFGGALKEIHAQLNLDDTTEGDLINTDNEDDVKDDLPFELVRYGWFSEKRDYFRLSDVPPHNLWRDTS